MEERRRFPRYPFQCKIAFSGDLVEGRGTTIDVSNLGCAVASDTKVQVGIYLNLRLHLPDQRVPLKIELAVVRWAGEGKIGVEFIRVHPKELEHLHQVIKLLEMMPHQ